MVQLLNNLNKIRNTILNKRSYEFLLKMNYKLIIIFGYIRGTFSIAKGKIKYEKLFYPLIIGPRTQLLIWPGSSIILKIDKKIDTVKNKLQSFAISIGAKAHYLVLDPPSNNSTKIELLEHSALILEKNITIQSGTYITGSKNSKITICENTYISHDVKINSRSSIFIGKNVLIGNETIIMDYDGHTIIYNENSRNIQKPIFIGDNVWIGTRSTLLKGVSIGSGSIIGANSCVVSDIPPNCIAAGNPAKIIKENILWER